MRQRSRKCLSERKKIFCWSTTKRSLQYWTIGSTEGSFGWCEPPSLRTSLLAVLSTTTGWWFTFLSCQCPLLCCAGSNRHKSHHLTSLHIIPQYITRSEGIVEGNTEVFPIHQPARVTRSRGGVLRLRLCSGDSVTTAGIVKRLGSISQ